MTGFREVTVSARAEKTAKSFGWTGDVKDRLCRMARRSAPVTHAKGNRRFDHFILSIKDGVLLDIYDTALAGEVL